MEAVTIHSEMGIEVQVIHTYTSYSDLEQIILAQRSDSGVKLTSLSLTRKPRTVYVPSDAMTALVKLWGAGQEGDIQAELDQAKSDRHDLHCETKDWEDWYHTVSRDAICLRAENEAYRSEIAALEQVIATMQSPQSHSYNGLLEVYSEKCVAYQDLADELEATQAALNKALDASQSQESFRMALLEGVASAARVAAEGGYQDWIPLVESLDALDAWQPGDASTAVSVPDDEPNPDEDLEAFEATYEAAKEDVRAALRNGHRG